MSLILVAQVLGMNLLSCPRKMVLIKLADNANDNGVCWPSYDHLAAHCNISRRTVIRHVNDLVLSGYVKRNFRKNGEFGNHSNLFQLTLENGDISTLKKVKTTPENEKITLVSESALPVTESHTLVTECQEVVTECQEVVTESPKSVTECHPELVIEPVKELVINNILSTNGNSNAQSVTKTRATKPKFIREIFLQYPAHRRGGTDAQLWTLWKQEKLTETDAAKILNWLFHAAHNDPQWATHANGQYVKGLTKFIRERIWLTPLPIAQNVQPTGLDMDDMTWANDINEGIL